MDDSKRIVIQGTGHCSARQRHRHRSHHSGATCARSPSRGLGDHAFEDDRAQLGQQGRVTHSTMRSFATPPCCWVQQETSAGGSSREHAPQALAAGRRVFAPSWARALPKSSRQLRLVGRALCDGGRGGRSRHAKGGDGGCNRHGDRRPERQNGERGRTSRARAHSRRRGASSSSTAAGTPPANSWPIATPSSRLAKKLPYLGGF